MYSYIEGEPKNFGSKKPVHPVARDLRIRYYDLKAELCQLYKDAGTAILKEYFTDEHDYAVLNRLMFNCVKILETGMDL